MAKKPPAKKPLTTQPGTRRARASSVDYDAARAPQPPYEPPTDRLVVVAGDEPPTPVTARESDDAVEERRKFLAEARRRWRMSADAESQLRKDMLEDLEFYNSDQWPKQVKVDRALDGRPCLTINRLPQFVRIVINQQRESKPAIQVNPVDNGADPDTAEVFQGLCRNIETTSKALIAYTTAGEHQAIMGRGFIRILAEYASDDSFEQEIKVKRVPDPFTVYPDPACAEPDYSDAMFGFVIERLPLEEYRARYGHQSIVSGLNDFTSIGDQQPDWCSTEGVLVADYYYIEKTRIEIADCLVASKEPGGTPDRLSLPLATIKPENRVENGGLIKVLKTRTTVRRQLKYAKINGVEVLDGNKTKTAGRDLPGRYVPLVPVLGEELIVDGKKNLRGMVRDAKDPQRAYNFWISAETEAIALAPRVPVIGAEGQFEGHEHRWAQANRRNFPYLEYNPVELQGHLVPAPARASFDPQVQQIVMATQQADRDLKSVIGMFDASQEKSPEQSGKAIIARQQQGEQGTSHFLDNLSRAIEHVGRILVDWIPVYYDKPRMLRIIGLDEKPRQVVVHAGQEGAAEQLLDGLDEKAKTILQGRPYDLSVGRYDVTITVGPSYQSRRQETVEALIQLVQAYPAAMPVLGDILVAHMDWPGAKQAAERLKKMVPPDLRDDEDGQPEIPPEIKAQMEQLLAQLQAAQEAIAARDELINTKAQELAAQGQIKAMEVQSRERIAAMQVEADLLKTQAQLKSDQAMVVVQAKLDEMLEKLKLEREDRRDARADEREARREARQPPPKPGGGGGRASARV